MKIMQLIDDYAIQADNHGLYGGAPRYKEKMVAARELVLKALEPLSEDALINVIATAKGQGVIGIARAIEAAHGIK